ncbi:MAG TPA: hypothetical protein VE131_12200 [Terriglobales bacterium]|nr:hypothetical protein [Terriglobales bacterium]
MKSKLDSMLCLVAALVFGTALFHATKWPFAAALFPLMATTLGLGLALTGLVAPLLGGGREVSKTTRSELSGKEVITFGWIFSFFALVALLGFQWGLPLATLVYLKLEGRAGNLLTILYVVACWVFLYAAQVWLHLSLYQGFVFSGLF